MEKRINDSSRWKKWWEFFQVHCEQRNFLILFPCSFTTFSGNSLSCFRLKRFAWNWHWFTTSIAWLSSSDCRSREIIILVISVTLQTLSSYFYKTQSDILVCNWLHASFNRSTKLDSFRSLNSGSSSFWLNAYKYFYPMYFFPLLSAFNDATCARLQNII